MQCCLAEWGMHVYLEIDDDGLLSSVGELLLLQAPPQVVVGQLQLHQQPRLSHGHGVHIVAAEQPPPLVQVVISQMVLQCVPTTDECHWREG